MKHALTCSLLVIFVVLGCVAADSQVFTYEKRGKTSRYRITVPIGGLLGGSYRSGYYGNSGYGGAPALFSYQKNTKTSSYGVTVPLGIPSYGGSRRSSYYAPSYPRYYRPNYGGGGYGLRRGG